MAKERWQGDITLFTFSPVFIANHHGIVRVEGCEKEFEMREDVKVKPPLSGKVAKL